VSKLRVTWRRSGINQREDQKRTIRALGLRRLGQTVEHEDTRTIRGMIHKVRHLVSVEDGGYVVDRVGTPYRCSLCDEWFFKYASRPFDHLWSEHGQGTLW
jgi:large subunit ribosomal protein L30